MSIFEPKFTYTGSRQKSRTRESEHEFQTKWRGGFVVYEMNRQTDGALFDWMRDNKNNLEPLNRWVKNYVEMFDFKKPWGAFAAKLPNFIFGNPKYQKGTATFMQQSALMAADAGNVFISNATYQSRKPPFQGPCYASLQLEPDGELWASDGILNSNPAVGSAVEQINGQWWTKEPQTAIGNLYKMRYTIISGSVQAYSNLSAGSGNYSPDISAARGIDVLRQSFAGPGTTAATFTLDIAGVGDSVIRDSATITLQAIITTFS